MNNSVVVAVVGAGYFAQFHVEGWRDAGEPVRAVCDIDVARAGALADRFGITHRFSSVSVMLDSLRPDLVDVVLPPAAQGAVVRSILERRIPVICQKPFGQDINDAVDLTRLAREMNTSLVVHENFRFMPWFRESKRLIDEGRLGRVYGISFRLRPGDGQGPAAYLDRQPYFRTMPRLLVRETAVHYIDTFRYLLGEVQAVTARLRRLNPEIRGEDAGIIVFEFKNAATGLFDGNRLNDHVADDPRRTMGEMWLEGSEGVLRLDGDAKLWWKPHRCPEVEHVYPMPATSAFGGACAALQCHVLSHLRRGAPLENAASDYLVNLQVQEAIYQSDATGTRVSMDVHHSLGR